MKKILVTGGKGQLAQCFKAILNQYSDFKFVFTDVDELDITNKKSIDTFFNQYQFDYCINCAAYTAVDKAEEEKDLSNFINNVGAQYIAEACQSFNIVLIHISTDFVFNGNTYLPYDEMDATHPISEYGKTKTLGEQAVKEALNAHFIIRTSWLYSEFANNFVKTMLKLANIKDQLSIIDNQIGTPTYAKDLAKAILHIINSNSKNYGVYHYSNQGVASWYDFAKAVFDIKNIDIKLTPIPSKLYPTPAARPFYSVLNKDKITKTFNIEIPYWRDSLITCLQEL